MLFVSQIMEHRAEQYIKYKGGNPNTKENMDKSEKIVSVGAGAFILLKGLSNIVSKPALGIAELAIGGGLIYRGLSGHCPVKDIIEKKEDKAMLAREKLISDTSTPLGI